MFLLQQLYLEDIEHITYNMLLTALVHDTRVVHLSNAL